MRRRKVLGPPEHPQDNRIRRRTRAATGIDATFGSHLHPPSPEVQIGSGRDINQFSSLPASSAFEIPPNPRSSYGVPGHLAAVPPTGTRRCQHLWAVGTSRAVDSRGGRRCSILAVSGGRRLGGGGVWGCVGSSGWEEDQPLDLVRVPAARGAGRSPNAVRYGLAGTEEAAAYLRDPVLPGRLLAATEAVRAHVARGAHGRSTRSWFAHRRGSWSPPWGTPERTV